MSLYEKVENDIKAAFLLAKTEKGASETLSEDTELKVIQKLVKHLQHYKGYQTSRYCCHDCNYQ